MLLAVANATLLDALSDTPRQGTILVEGERIVAIGEVDIPQDATVVNGQGKFVIPGLMNANVHLLLDVRLDSLAQYWGRYDELILEAAQVALKNGLTTVFDTWGPRRFLMAVRERINSGELEGSRVLCAGNIIGFDGPFSHDFDAAAAAVGSKAFVDRINAIWVENTGRHLMWLPPDRVAAEIRSYVTNGIDFVKYGSNEHIGTSAGAFLAFSAGQQEAIVSEAHAAGLTAQAHCMSVEGLRTAIEAGCDLITHCNLTGPEPIPESTIAMFAERNVGAVVFPWTEAGFEWLRANVTDYEWTFLAGLRRERPQARRLGCAADARQRRRRPRRAQA
jgi:imidazolonepropionase-like amidohydrolase